MLALTAAKNQFIQAFMSIFATNKAMERLEDRLKVVEIQCQSLDSTSKKLDLEFTELFDKVRHQMSRMAARHAKAEKENGPLEEPTEGISHLDSLDPISKSIMLRRSGYRG